MKNIKLFLRIPIYFGYLQVLSIHYQYYFSYIHYSITQKCIEYKMVFTFLFIIIFNNLIYLIENFKKFSPKQNWQIFIVKKKIRF